MSASLVGSEMCIRDRFQALRCWRPPSLSRCARTVASTYGRGHARSSIESWTSAPIGRWRPCMRAARAACPRASRVIQMAPRAR
eukprot:11266274-Alexandrium_andersonii.AAC.1